MNKLQIFDYQGVGVRTVIKDNEPWFVAKDICEALDIQNATQALYRLDEDERSMFNIGRQGDTNIVNEYGLYNLILSSRKPEAKQFKRWITHEVIPSIRKHGGYLTPEKIEEALSDPDTIIRLATDLKNERKKRVEAEKTNSLLMHVNKTYTATEIAKEIGFRSATALNADLEERKIQYKQNGTWVLYSKYADKGYVDIKQEILSNGTTLYHRKWTQLGREFLLKLYERGGSQCS